MDQLSACAVAPRDSDRADTEVDGGQDVVLPITDHHDTRAMRVAELPESVFEDLPLVESGSVSGRTCDHLEVRRDRELVEDL